MKLIHSGKVLKDDDKIDSCNIKPNDFLVVMIAKVRQNDKRRRNCDCIIEIIYLFIMGTVLLSIVG